MTLYTVKLTREEIICRYDPITGFRHTETKRDIPQVYGDMPLVLAQRYAIMFPNNNVEIIAQESAYEVPSQKLEHREPATARKMAHAKLSTIEPKPSAAATGDLAAALER